MDFSRKISEDIIGCDITEIDTPALIVDLDLLQKNIAKMAAFAATSGLGLRPHAKAHKSPKIGALQMAAGAIGLCFQKLEEAEVFAETGLEKIFITNEIVGIQKARRLARLAEHCDVTIAIDDESTAAFLAKYLAEANVQIGAVVDIDIGQNRCGVAPGAEALRLAQEVERLPGLKLLGLQGYQGKLQHVVGRANRHAQADAANQALIETRRLFEKSGLRCDIVTGGGTGTYDTPSARETLTEIQPGSYIFMDSSYRSTGGRETEINNDFDLSLSVLSTVTSLRKPGRAIVDAGLKALSTDSGSAILSDLAGWAYQPAGDEHGALIRTGDGASLKIGDVVRLTPSHCDTTVNLYDRYHIVSKGRLVDIWPIPARGCMR